MIKDRLGISLTFNNLFRHPKNGFLFRNNFNIELQPYIPLKGKCYFVPSIGIYTTSFSTSAKIKLPNTLFSNITPQMVYVGNRNILKIGIETMYNFNLKNRNIDKRLSASTMLSYHHFLSSKLAIKFEAWGNLTGLNWGQDSYIFWEPTGATHFQIGFDYFYQKN